MKVIRLLLTFVILALIQALVLNRITLFGCATPLLYVYFIIPTRRNFPKWTILTCGFIMGLCMDIFTNTPGVAAASLTCLAFVQPLLLNMFLQKDSPDDLLPSFKSLGTMKYISYTFLCVLIYCLLFFSIETFSFFNWQQWLLDIGGSTLLTVLIVIIIENVRHRE